jgi:20S proteasome alpha/beta subunit
MGENTTICIAAIVDDQYIAVVADRKFSYGFISSDYANKLKPVGKKKSWCVMYAAENVGPIPDILARVNTQLGDEEFTPERIADVFCKSYSFELQRHIERSILSRYKLTFPDFLASKKQLDNRTYAKIQGQIEAADLRIAFLIRGFDSDRQPQLFSIGNPGVSYSRNEEGFAVIGIGYDAATTMLCRGYHIHLSLGESVYRLLEAKFVAEDASDISKKTQLLVFGYEPKKEFLGGWLLDQKKIDTVRQEWKAP